ncbi:protease [Stappia sp. GBMRC 2046]|uniref:Tricorn protease homolog n=1 Tax=Stappia sediminis TaxID=2692190 RepID=A0A7X3LS67_9HYPH|nr:S41 family peptidase [Stappia sediminis]MXN64105.1 protease [Stappia sediminis]
MRMRFGLVLGLSCLAIGTGICPQTAAAQAGASERPYWMRDVAISPDGTQIAFSYRGQIFVVPAEGGDALPLTERQFYSTHPVWSPDSSAIAFASDRHNKNDVFVMPAEGGEIKRLTYHSAGEIPLAFSPGGTRVFFNAERLGDPEINFLQGFAGNFGQVYSVPVTGGREHLEMPFAAPQAAISPNGQFLAYRKVNGLEVEWRKGDISDQTSDIWIYDFDVGKHHQLTTHRGNDRSPVWSSDGTRIIFASEMPESGMADPDARPGTFNVWSIAADGKSAPERLTAHDTLPVRFVSTADDGTIVYTYDTEIWRLAPGAKTPERVNVRIRQGTMASGAFFVKLNGQTSEMKVSPNGKELAIVARGDVFTVSLENGQTKRITATPQTERSIDFSPDGRKLLYAAEREGDWDLYETEIARENDATFTDALELKERALLDTDTDALQPLYSPDGKRVAYRDDRNAIRVLDIESRNSVEVLPDSAAYSYSEGDLSHAWSPDGKHIVTSTGFGLGNLEVELVDAEGKAPRVKVSDSGFADMKPQFSADGTIVYWATDRFSTRNLDEQTASPDYFAAFLTNDAYQAFKGARKEAAGGEKTAEAATTAEIRDDIEGLRYRKARLSSMIPYVQFARLTPDNKRLILVAYQPTIGMVGYAVDTRTQAPRQLFARAPNPSEVFATDKDVKALYVLSAATIDRYDLASGAKSSIPFEIEAAYDFQAEMEYIFDHQWRLVKSKFYDANMHGVDWEKMHDLYAKYLPHISHWEDFAELMAELQGELNASHMYTQFKNEKSFWDKTATLGVFYESAHKGAGVKIQEILAGGPADFAGGALKAGAVILSVDGKEIGAGTDIYPLLDRKAGKKVMLKIRPVGGDGEVEQIVVPDELALEGHLAYLRWIDQRQAIVERLSNGRLGYAHVAAMNDGEFRKTYGVLMGRYRDAEAAIIDVRFNIGGLLHDQLTAFLTGERHSGLVTRNGVDLGTSPYWRWAKPTALLANAYSYSDGSVFPYYYIREKLGPSVGARVPGTGTAVLSAPQQEQRLSLAVAQIGFRTQEGEFFENREIVPDEVVYNDPNSIMEGRDLQLERVVELMLEALDKKR